MKTNEKIPQPSFAIGTILSFPVDNSDSCDYDIRRITAKMGKIVTATFYSHKGWEYGIEAGGGYYSILEDDLI